MGAKAEATPTRENTARNFIFSCVKNENRLKLDRLTKK